LVLLLLQVLRPLVSLEPPVLLEHYQLLLLAPLVPLQYDRYPCFLAF
jgi:hypothetical protein